MLLCFHSPLTIFCRRKGSLLLYLGANGADAVLNYSAVVFCKYDRQKQNAMLPVAASNRVAMVLHSEC